MAHAEAAISLTHKDAGKAEFGKLLPQRMTEAVLASLVAPMAQLLGDGAFLAHELARGVGQHGLVFSMIQRHGSGSRQVENAFGNDVQHDFAGAAFDRVGLGAQPVAGL